MIDILRDWFHRNFSDPQVVMLALLLAAGFLTIAFLGDMLAPVIAALVIGYLLEGLVKLMEERRVPRLISVLTVFSLFMVFMLLILLVLVPLLSQQITQLVQELPAMVSRGQEALKALPQRYPDFVSTEQIAELLSSIREEVAKSGQSLVAISLESIPGLVTLLVYLILVPLLVFFFLKDKGLLKNWFSGFLPADRQLARDVWREMDQQLSNYVRGKFWEILIVGGVSFVTFQFMGLNYAALLALLVGLSVIIPYIGATVVTFPVAIIGAFQWGWTPEFMYLMIAYGIIQVLDGNVLVPVLFSEAVNLHPIAIIVAILFFGGLWGFWGVFFAIPLATLVKAVLSAWPTAKTGEDAIAAA